MNCTIGSMRRAAPDVRGSISGACSSWWEGGIPVGCDRLFKSWTLACGETVTVQWLEVRNMSKLTENWHSIAPAVPTSVPWPHHGHALAEPQKHGNTLDWLQMLVEGGVEEQESEMGSVGWTLNQESAHIHHQARRAQFGWHPRFVAKVVLLP